MKHKRLFFLAELAIAAFVLVWAFLSVRQFKPIELSISDWTCDTAVYHDGAFSVEDGLLNSGEETVFLYGPGTPLKKGSYAAKIRYEAERDQYCEASGANTENFLIAPADFVHASKGVLSHGLNEITYRFEVPEDARKFDLRIFYDGQGTFQVNSITMQQTSARQRRTAATVIMILLGLDQRGRVIFTDSATRDWAGERQRLKTDRLSSLMAYMFPQRRRGADKLYFDHRWNTGGFILVDGLEQRAE